MFGGSVDKFAGKDDAFEDSIDVLDGYLDGYLDVIETAERDPSFDRAAITRDAALRCKVIFVGCLSILRRSVSYTSNHLSNRRAS